MTNGAANTIVVCMVLLTIEMTAVLGAIIFLALRLSRTIQSVEALVYRVEDKVAAFKTGWIRTFQSVGGLVTGFMGARKHERQRAHERDGEPAGRY